MKLKLEIDQGKYRRTNPTYNKILYQLKKWGHNIKQSRVLRTMLRQTPTKDYMDPKYLRLHYLRYADDFVIAIGDPRRLAVEILNKVQDFLADKLKLDLSEEKTKLTHFIKKPIFLGAFILNRILKKNKPVNTDVHGHKKRISIHISLGAPTMKLKRPLMEKGFMKYDKDRFSIRVTALNRVINLEHASILQYYQSIISVIINYYTFANNRSDLWSCILGLKYGCALTLTKK
jgi:hypothetical protein